MNYEEYLNCPFNKFLNILNGKWKPMILYVLFKEGDIRFTEIWRKIPKVSKKVLLEQLNSLELDGILYRKQINTFPPEVYYGLSDKGKTLGPLIIKIEKWVTEIYSN